MQASFGAGFVSVLGRLVAFLLFIFVAGCSNVVSAHSSQKRFSGVTTDIDKGTFQEVFEEDVVLQTSMTRKGSTEEKTLPSQHWSVRRGAGHLYFIGEISIQGADQYRQVMDFRNDGGIWHYNVPLSRPETGARGTVFRGSTPDFLEPPLSSCWVTTTFCGFTADSSVGATSSRRGLQMVLKHLERTPEKKLSKMRIDVSAGGVARGQLELNINYAGQNCTRMETIERDFTTGVTTLSVAKVVSNRQVNISQLQPRIGSKFADATTNDFYELGPSGRLVYLGTKGESGRNVSTVKLAILIGPALVFLVLYTAVMKARRLAQRASSDRNS